MEPEVLERRISKLQRKFNLLCNWLQIKFPEDVTFPRSLAVDADDFKHKFEETSMPITFKTENEEAYHEHDTKDAVRPDEFVLGPSKATELGSRRITEQTKFKLAPCFINLERLRLKACRGIDPSESVDLPAEVSAIANANADDGRSDNLDYCTNSSPGNSTEQDTRENRSSSPAPIVPDYYSQTKSQINQRQAKKTLGSYTVRCPFCDFCYTRRYIYAHIRTYHQERATKEILRSVRESLNLGHKITIPFKHKLAQGSSDLQIPAKVKLERQPVRSRYIMAAHVKKYPCPGCHLIYQKIANYQSHIKNRHPEIYDEKIESGEFTLDDTHSKDDGRNIYGKCPVCAQVFRQVNLESHIQKKHGDKESFLCSQCGHKTNSKHTLATHMETHSEERKYKCKQCPYAARQYEGLRMHVLRKHDPAKITMQCSLCGELFKGSHNLKNHIANVHTNVRKYQCSLCDKAFKQASHLKYHIKTHDNPNARKRGLNRERPPLRRKHFIPTSISPPSGVISEPNLNSEMAEADKC